jgi:methylated-DNA-[protein]-cysteine S-methyltransferase
MNSYATLKTKTVGNLLLVADDKYLLGVYFADCDHTPTIENDWTENPKHPILKKAAAELTDYLAGKRTTFSVDLHAPGTEFQKAIWREIARIPFGQTITYSELAQRVRAPNAHRAAGTATGQNPHSLIVPCHRVIGKHGALGGYAGGLQRKQKLLALESTRNT